MGSGGTEAGTRGVKIPHHQVPTGKNECGRSYSRIDREEILGLFLHAPTAMIGGVLVGFRVLTIANSFKPVTKYRFLQSPFLGPEGALEVADKLPFRLLGRRNRCLVSRISHIFESLWISAIANLRDPTGGYVNVITSFRQVAGVVKV
jgi:hypothetical protein